MAVKVELENDRTGERKTIKVGWSWTLLLFTQVFGLPLFLRRLYLYGFVMAALCAGHMALVISNSLDIHPDYKNVKSALTIGALILLQSFVFAGIGNKLAGQNLLKKGWSFAHPNDRKTEYAKEKWSL